MPASGSRATAPIDGARPTGTRATGTVLDRIVADRRVRLAEDRRAVPEAALDELAASLPGAVVDFAARLRDGRTITPPGARVRLIAEVKRASPSRGLIDGGLDPVELAQAYVAAGAAAVSVLTEPDHFMGDIAFLRDIRLAFGADADRPALLRKDFIFDPYQVHEAHANGADALLLIVAMLTPGALGELVALTREHGLEPLVEVHDEAELAVALAAGARVVGVNNRDLRTFEENLGTTEQLAPLIPGDVTVVAESAIRTAADARRMAGAGAHALLVGEALVRASREGAARLSAAAHELMLIGEQERSA